MGTVRTYEELGARVRDIRLAKGLEQGALARAVGLERSALSRVERGQRKLSALEAIQLVRALGVSLADLVSTPARDVRAARPALLDEAVGLERDAALADLDLDRAMREAEMLRGFGVLSVADVSGLSTAPSDADGARRLARRVRDRLGVADEPLGAMADVAATLGLWVRTTTAGISGRSMTPEPGFGVAVVGQSLESGRRRMTVAHEVGHHLAGDTYAAASHYQPRAEVEDVVEAFAAELLLPERVVRGLAEVQDLRPAMLDIALQYRVSWTVVCRTARATGLVVSRSVVDRRPDRGEFLALAGTTPQEDLVAPGMARQWVRACARAVVEGRITILRAQEMTAGLISVEDDLDEFHD